MSVVFFDVGETLAMPRLSADSQLLSLCAYPFAAQVLARLKADGHRLGLIADTGSLGAVALHRLLNQAGLYGFFSPDLLIYSAEVGLTKSSADIFELAVKRSAQPNDCTFVGNDARERSFALQAGLRVAPHALLADCVVRGDSIHYARIAPPLRLERELWTRVLEGRALVPLHLTRGDAVQLLIVAGSADLATLDDLGFYVDRLGAPNAPCDTDLYLLRDDLQKATGFLVNLGNASPRFGKRNAGHYLLSSNDEGLFVALPAAHSIESFHLHGARHGHCEKLIADPTVLTTDRADDRMVPMAMRARPEALLNSSDLEALQRITPDLMRAHIERYSGKAHLDERERRIKSRHIHHAHNQLATERLLEDLAELGGAAIRVRRHRFVHEGKELFNVEAELGDESAAEVVLITAHLDSTGANVDGPYHPESDDAPGADDDASGVAGVLAAAQVLCSLLSSRALTRRVRFVLFNAEEHGLVGSKAYARDAAFQGTRIVGVYQMDMIGYRRREGESRYPFEIHVGFELSRQVEQRSLRLANKVAQLCTQVSPRLMPPQIYTSAHTDPAAGRSDHASFQDRGYAACVVSEDFFAGPESGSAQAEPNPDYHKPSDKNVNFSYAADIARVVAAAALCTALDGI